MLEGFGRIGSWLAVAGLLSGVLVGCGKASKTYSIAPEAAWAALMGTTIPGMAFGEAAHGMPAQGTPARVEWAIEAGPDQGAAWPESHHIVMRLTATLTAVAGGTEVTVDVQPAGGDNSARIEALDRQLPAVARMWRAIAGEQVDAVLTHRPFDMANIREAIAAATMSQLPQIGKRMEEAGKEAQRHEQDKIDQAYALDKHGG